LPIDEVLLNDALQNLGRTRVVPGALRIDDCDRPTLTDPQTVGLRAIHPTLFRESQLGKAAFQVLPRDQTLLPLRALRNRLVRAEEDVSANLVDAVGRRDPLERISHAPRGADSPALTLRACGRRASPPGGDLRGTDRNRSPPPRWRGVSRS